MAQGFNDFLKTLPQEATNWWQQARYGCGSYNT